MRYLPLALALLLAAGCTVEAARPGVTPPSGAPRPTATATATATPAPASPSPSASPTLSPDAYVLVIRRRGGLCPYGPCEGMMTFQADGRFSDSEGRDGYREGKVDPALAAAVVAETEKADFAALKARPFTGTCPTAYDGQEKIYSFPVGVGEEDLQSCTYEIDEAHPLFRAVRAIEAAARPAGS